MQYDDHVDNIRILAVLLSLILLQHVDTEANSQGAAHGGWHRKWQFATCVINTQPATHTPGETDSL